MTDADLAPAPSAVPPTAAGAKPWPAMTVAHAHALLTAPGMPFEMETLTIRGLETRVWRNAPPTLRAEVEAGRAFGPDRYFLVYEDERVSFDAFHRAVAAFAAELAGQGVAKGDRVAIVMRNRWPSTPPRCWGPSSPR